jgi:diguanylate cyclase (GGDEF)-like protein
MIAPEMPLDESRRVTTLRALKILDTSPEERFDRVTRLARRVFEVPIALVSLVDEERQWFKSSVGLNASQTPRDISFCGHTILGNGTFIVEDAIQDERFYDNPLVLGEPHIRFYAGCPLRYLDGSKLGTLCLIDARPRSLTTEDLAILRDLADMVEQELAAIQLATMDELTRLSNRRGFIALAEQSLLLCARQNLPASLIFFDLNRFKPINDQFGHAEGDRALKAYAEIMRGTFRHSDVLARLGGDEFVAFLSDASVEFVADILFRFRRSVRLHNQSAQRGYDICFAEGVVNVDLSAALPMDELLSQADRLMYQKKRGLSIAR